MNHVGKETAENFYGTEERDHQLILRYDGVRGCDSEKEVSWPERRTVPGGWEISTYLAAARAHSGIFLFLWGVPNGQASMYIGEGSEGRARE